MPCRASHMRLLFDVLRAVKAGRMSTIPGLPLSGSVRILIAATPVDFRKGADGLAALAKGSLGAGPVHMCRVLICGGVFPIARDSAAIVGVAATYYFITFSLWAQAVS